MKKKFIVPVLALALGTSSLAGCKQGGGNKPQPQPSGPTYTGIRLDTTAMDLEVEYAETAVSLEGLVVYAQYSDSTEQAVSSGYTWSSLEISGTERLQLRKEVTITYQSKSAKVNFTILPEPAKNWTETEIALMEAHLLGQSVPYIELGTYEVEWDEPNIYIEGGEVDQATILEYAKKWKDFGWACGGTEYSSGIQYYSFSKEIERQDDAPAIVEGLFYATDSSYLPKASGAFFLRASVNDSFDKDWPTAKVASLVSEIDPTATSVVAPFTAEYFEVVPSDAEYYGYIKGYKVESDPSTSYLASLAGAGWVIDSESYAYTYALSPDEKFGIIPQYDASAKTFKVNVTEARKLSKDWPATQIASIVSSYGKGDVVPAFAGEEALLDVVSFVTIENQIVINVKSGKEAAVAAAYEAMVAGATGWHHHKFFSTNSRYVSPSTSIDLVISVEASKYPGKVFVILVPYQPNEYLMYDEVIPSTSADRLPSAFDFASYEEGFCYAYSSALYYEVREYVSVTVWSESYNLDYWYYILQGGQYLALKDDDDLTSQEKLDAAIAEYGAVYEVRFHADEKAAELNSALLAAGFIPYGTGPRGQYMASPNEDFQVVVYNASSAVYVYYSSISADAKVYTHSASFPSEQIAAYLPAGYTSVPALAGASDHIYASSETGFNVAGRYASPAAAEEAKGIYITALTTANFTEKPADSGKYVSEEGDVTVEVSTFGCYVALTIVDSAVFPLAQMAAFLGEEGNYTEANVPVVEKAAGLKFSGEGAGTGYSKSYTATVTFASAEAAQQAATDYEAALEAKGFAESPTTPHLFGNSSLALQAYVTVSESTVSIVFSSIWVYAWDVADLNSTYDISLPSAKLPNLVIKSYTPAGSNHFTSGNLFYYLACSSLDEAREQVESMSDVYYYDYSDSWAYAGYSSNSYYYIYYFQSRVYPWLVAYMYVSYIGTTPCLFVAFSENTDAREFSEFLGVRYYTMSVPEINDGNGFSFEVDSETGKGYVTFGSYETEADALTAKSAYESALVGYDFTQFVGYFFDGYTYVTPSVKSQGEGDDQVWYVELEFEIATRKEGAKYFFDGFFAADHSRHYEDFVPVLPLAREDVTISDFDYDRNFISIELTFADDTEGDDPQSGEAKAGFAAVSYINQLTDPESYNFSFVDVPDSDEDYYLSADGLYKVFVSVDGASLTISVSTTLMDRAVAALNDFIGASYTNALPSIEGMSSNIIYLQNSGDVGMMFEFDSASQTQTAYESYVDALEKMGFTYDAEVGAGSRVVAGIETYVYVIINENGKLVIDLVYYGPAE